MVADETTGPAHQRSFSDHWLRGHLTSSRLFRNQVHAFRTIPYTECRLAWLEPSYRPSGDTHHPAWPDTKQRAISAVQLSCCRRKRRTVKTNRNRGSHQSE